MIQAVFFDMDNTLVDTEWAAGRAVRLVIESFGIVCDPADELAVIGIPWETIFTNYPKKYRIPLSYDEFKDKVLDTKAAILGQVTHELPGATEALRRCAKRYPVAVVSGSYRHEVQATLSALKVLDFVRFFIANEDSMPGKPDPKPYLLAAERLNVDPKRCVVFEDSEVGVKAARSAGMFVIAVLASNPAGFALEQAHERIPSLEIVDDAWLDTLSLRLGTHP